MSGRPPLVLAVAQPHSALYQVATNVAHHVDLIVEAAARVVVFPELSLTGYAMDAEPLDPADPRLAPLVEACDATDSVALVGAPTAGGAAGRTAHALPSISMLRVDGAGISVAYDKMWLGGPEAEHFSPGRRPAVIDVDGWRLGLAICKDTGVSTHASVVASRGIDVYVAGVCETEDDRDVQPQRARRVIADLGVWVAVAGFAGPTGGGFDSTAGRSSIWRPDGRLAASLDSRPGQVARATLDGPSVVDR